MPDNTSSLWKEKSIVFIGFMGVGKTTIGELVAEKLNRDFIDADQEIEKELGMKTADIFQTYGEAFFRAKEKEVITYLSQQKEAIISVGGGAFLQEEIRQICLDHCIVVCLDLSWKSWKERMNLLIDTRPVLQGRSLSDIKDLFYQRQAIYSNHHININTDSLPAEVVAEHVITSIHNLQFNQK
ncbi:shikimate kinase [Priestia megaterium]|nr:shikimate kinase [Priestia megaterium]